MNPDGSPGKTVSDLIDRLELVQSELQSIQKTLQGMEPRASAEAHDPALAKVSTKNGY